MQSPRAAFSLVLRAIALSSIVSAGAVACRNGDPPAPPGPSGAPAASSNPSSASVAAAQGSSTVRAGNALARATDGSALYVADEDHQVVRRVPLPIDVHTPAVDVKMPGPPAQVVVLGASVLVTVRGVSDGDVVKPPGLLMLLGPDADKGLVEKARVELPADAWGVAVTPDEKIALVTSAWTHQVSAVDLGGAKKLWSADVAREPRGVAVLPDGKTAYVTHLLRASLTRFDDLGAPGPKMRVVPFPAAPERMPAGPDKAEREEAATLGYAPVLSPDGGRLYLARQALGATGKRAWNGQSTVDVLLTADETELATGIGKPFIMLSEDFTHTISLSERIPDFTVTGPGPTVMEQPFVAARAALYRGATKTLLVASEGTDELVELDTLSLDPSAKPLQRYRLASRPALDWPVDTWIRPVEAAQEAWNKTTPGATQCGAPTGLALAADEKTAWVFCRSTDSIAIVRLDGLDPVIEPSPIPTVSLGADPLPEQAALGRRLFYDASDLVISGGFSCNGCHPEGRDDGHVWHELENATVDAAGTDTGKFEEARLNAFAVTVPDMLAVFERRKAGSVMLGAPRQTPMLVGRVAAAGPYGWKGASPNLRHRVVTGFKLHRWDDYVAYGAGAISRADALALFLRKLVAPPREERELTAEEQRGRAVFNNPEVDCVGCHAPQGGEYTTRAMAALGTWRVDKLSFEEEHRGWKFKTPSLRWVGATPPYFHDGSAATLEDLVEHDGGRMGHMEKLSADDRAALVAFLKTL